MTTLPGPIPGLKIDAEKLGAGLYALLCRRGQAGIVAVGMLPADFSELAEKMIREKLQALSKTPLEPAVLEDLVEEVWRTARAAIYAAAERQGKMLR